MAIKNAQINNFSLQNAEIVTQRLVHMSSVQRDLRYKNLASRGGQVSVQDFFAPRQIQTEGVIVSPTQDQLDIAIDEMKAQLLGLESDLDIDHGGTTRRYKVFTEDISFSERSSDVTRMDFQIQFKAVDPFGQDTIPVSLTFNNNTANPKLFNVAFGGTAQPFPEIKIEFDSATNITDVEVKNNLTGLALSVPRTNGYSAGDVIRINNDTFKVTVNGIEVPWTGVFPFCVGGIINQFQFSYTGTSYQADVTFTYTNRYY